MWFLAEVAGKGSSINPDRPSGSEREDLFSHPGGRVGSGGEIGERGGYSLPPLLEPFAVLVKFHRATVAGQVSALLIQQC